MYPLQSRVCSCSDSEMRHPENKSKWMTALSQLRLSDKEGRHIGT